MREWSDRSRGGCRKNASLDVRGRLGRSRCGTIMLFLLVAGFRTCVARRLCSVVRGCIASQRPCTLRPVRFLSLSRCCSAKSTRGTGWGLASFYVLPLLFLSQELIGMFEYVKLVSSSGLLSGDDCEAVSGKSRGVSDRSTNPEVRAALP